MLLNMKKNHLFLGLIVVAVLSLSFAACKPTSKSYIRSFRIFVEKIEKNGASYTKEQWKTADSEFVSFLDERYKEVKETLTDKDKKMVGELAARYIKVRWQSLDVVKALNWIKSNGEIIVCFLRELGFDVCDLLETWIGIDVCGLLGFDLNESCD